MPTLLLQKPSHKSKSKEHATHLQRRLELWRDGDILSLLEEGRCLQKHLQHTSKPPNEDTIAHVFSCLMMQGKVKSAMNYLSQNSSGSILRLENMLMGQQTVNVQYTIFLRTSIHQGNHLKRKPSCNMHLSQLIQYYLRI